MVRLETESQKDVLTEAQHETTRKVPLLEAETSLLDIRRSTKIAETELTSTVTESDRRETAYTAVSNTVV